MAFITVRSLLFLRVTPAIQRWDDAVRELDQAVAIGRRIEYPTLTWQAGHLLARAQAADGKVDEAAATARLTLEIIEGVAARAPEPALRRTFTEWARVQTAREELGRMLG